MQLLQGKAAMAQDAEPDKRFFYGSGFIVTPDGHAVTNKHVTHNSVSIWVTLSDGRQLPAELISEAIGLDIAVIKIRTDKPLPTVKLGDSDTVRQGELAIAIGNPLDFASTVTTGVISALNRDMGFTPFDDYMQTDAAINHGNSGGPLFNREGEVIGVNSAIYTTGSDTGNVGIGLVIPINDAKFAVEHMHDARLGKGRLAWLGAQVVSLTPELAGAVRLARAVGLDRRAGSGGHAGSKGAAPQWRHHHHVRRQAGRRQPRSDARHRQGQARQSGATRRPSRRPPDDGFCHAGRTAAEPDIRHVPE